MAENRTNSETRVATDFEVGEMLTVTSIVWCSGLLDWEWSARLKAAVVKEFSQED